MEKSTSILDFTDLIVWRKAVAFGRLVYHLSASFPNDERFGLTSQIRRAAVSISPNIAEGHARHGREFARFLSISKGSTAEVESQLLFALELGYLEASEVDEARRLAAELHRMIATLLSRLSD